MAAAPAVPAEATSKPRRKKNFCTQTMNRVPARDAILSLVGRDAVEPGNVLTTFAARQRLALPRKESRLQLVRRPRFALGHFAAGQFPRTLFLERQRQQLADRQLLFIPER